MTLSRCPRPHWLRETGRKVGIYRRIRRGTAGGVETGIRSLLRYPDRHLTHLFVRGHQVQVVDRRGTRPLLFLP